MLSHSAPSTESLSASENKLSRKQRRALARGDSVEASKSEDAASVPESAPQTPPVTDNGERVSPYPEVINKKMRALRKKLTKIEKYEQLDRNALNADQLQTLQKKPELVFAVKELEEVAKGIAAADNDEAKLTAQMMRQTEQDTQKRVQDAVNAAKAEGAQNVKAILELMYVLDYVLPNIASISVGLTDDQYNTLAYFRMFITGFGLEQVDTPKAHLELAQAHVDKYLTRDSSEFMNGVTYAQLADWIVNIRNPPAPPQFRSEAAEELSTEQDVEPTEVETDHKPRNITGGISFFNPSEVLDIQTEHTEVVTTDLEGVTTHLTVEHVVIESVPEGPDEAEDIAAEPASVEQPQETPEASTEGRQQSRSQQQGEGQHQPRQHRGRGRGGYRGGRGRGAGYGGQHQGGHYRGGYRGRGGQQHQGQRPQPQNQQ
ncbi:hypothetical protein BC832DRAFT_593329 [Gaertneriomyces semiglobifer]|nr:hypothetical protein BC832DRAFT_593329 [Gaertneriomyces semiglobifer]